MTATVSTEGVRFTVPSFTPAARDAALAVLDSGWVTTGPECAAFESELAAALGADHVVTVSTCTHALELCLRALRLPAGAPVLTASLTFSGAVAAIVHAGYRPVLVDVDSDTLVPSPATVARAGRAAAMVVTHLGGTPVDVAALAGAAGLPLSRVVEDAAHGPGGDLTGAGAQAACFSFYATKNLPIGEGGAVATTDGDLADWLRSARLHGLSRDAWRRYLPGGSWRYDVPEIGFKANLTDLQAAIGRAQLAALPAWQARRAAIATRYDAALAGGVAAGLVRLPRRHPGSAWHLYQVRVPHRDAVIERLTAAGIGTSVHFIPVHQLTAYAALLGPDAAGAVPVTDRVAGELLSLPLYPALTDHQIERVATALLTTLDDIGGDT